MSGMSNVPEARLSLDQERHIRYWTRCLKTLLPHHYTGNESNRMYLAFFIISALDLLGAWNTITKESERQGYIDWIYHCQHPAGGFRMWPGTNFGERANEANSKWDPANIPATYFALSALLILKDDMKRVRRKQTLQWLVQMQRPDGSFGETLVGGHIEGGRDPRFGYCATGIRHILRGDSEGSLTLEGSVVEDIEVDDLVRCIEAAESYEGGLADQRYHEPHAGYTFCALGCLDFIHRIKDKHMQVEHRPQGPADVPSMLAWLVARQTDLDDPDMDVGSDTETAEPTTHPAEAESSEPVPLHQSPEKSTMNLSFGLDPLDAGMNGRTNKVADTCYAWWVCGSFHMLGYPDLYNKTAVQRYLLQKTQHAVLGGFGKFPGDLPDLYHSYMGLAALGLSGAEGLKAVDGTMCISEEAVSGLPDLWNAWRNSPNTPSL
ncbi:related to protein geranylgeranyltransferase Type I, beta subunit [Ramularia collo-cygni]|uniref:Related to protein geranylgeranyltransferase Type I, beta subunit n=1 Tax=Ramularia collo-cygni TaxID=112498 RepID=A0A2D3UYN6_9PEZI|nr:related to protein geranylgeranyltransferase Type I, beta subunit [Ramularia collo-cygni]CZT18320.1 related to protein geranylgeranyltransferase Type I, beta subunit [Ramularia collo-cygni]